MKKSLKIATTIACCASYLFAVDGSNQYGMDNHTDNNDSNVIKADFFKGNTNLKKIVIPPNIASIGSSTFEGCSNLNGIAFFMSPIISIGPSAFKNCSSLGRIKIPGSVISIGSNAFKGCSSLRKIEFDSPSHLTSIGKNAFKDCSVLEQLQIPRTVTSTGEAIFKAAQT